jgi:acyl-homoserine lactone acylase PvdQ
MQKLFLIALLLPFQLGAQSFSKSEINRWKQQAKNVTIIRDNWGIPHIYGKTDADAVFGLLYAQCEDDFNRVEMNYIEKLGRKAELLGEKEVFNDLYTRLVISSNAAIDEYKRAPAWLKKLLNAYANAVNFYLYQHPETKPALLKRFEPWYPLMWTDGSIGAISTGDITEQDVKNFYTGSNALSVNEKKFKEIETGSNGFALAPSKTESGNAILYINPHTTFYFRPEVHMNSEEGLNAYGAVTWGQFFIYQGFNESCGWMHTSSNADVSDMYAEKITKNKEKWSYTYNGKQLPVKQTIVPIKYKSGDKTITKYFTGYFTKHGPIMANRNGQYISVKSYNRNINGLMQSWLRTKANGFDDYKKAMDIKANTSNNTVFADKNGNIAYWHGNFMPIRDTSYNWSKVVDGTTSATEWKGFHSVDQTVHVYNPATGWIQNCNSTPFTVSGSASPVKKDYPVYMAPDGENFRGINAARVLQRESKFTLDKIITAGYDRNLTAFEVLLPALINAYEKLPATDSLKIKLQAPIAVLKAWDYHTDINSIATTLAIEWAQLLSPSIRKVYIDEGEDDQVSTTKKFAATATSEQLLNPLMSILTYLTKKFGTWEIPWGKINRFQRISSNIEWTYDDAQPSFPVPFASALWGMLPSYNSRTFKGTDLRYGISGNSFVCAVEFGPRIKAKSLLAGGNSGQINSPHFADQAAMYTKGQFKEVLFYKEDVLKHTQKTYHPGE